MTGAGTGATRLDQSKLDELKALERPGNEGFYARILDTFLKDAGTRVQDMKEGVSSGDLPSAALAAHTLKGSCAYVGAIRLADLLNDFEATADAGLRPAGTIAEIETELASVQEMLNDEIGRT